MATDQPPPDTVVTEPINIPEWLSHNSHRLAPPINNYLLYNNPLTVQIISGPNARTDYHINPTPELFYQLRGKMLLKTVQNGQFKDIYINERSVFLLPENIPHNPIRFADSMGLAIELPSASGRPDRLRWYCQDCGEQVHEVSFVCVDLGTQLKGFVEAFAQDTNARTCRSCGALCEVAPSPEAMEKVARGGVDCSESTTRLRRFSPADKSNTLG